MTSDRMAPRQQTSVGRRIRLAAPAGLMFLSVAALAPIGANAQTSGTLAPLYQFTGGADGGQPLGGVTRDANGTLYGETSLGGTGTCTSKAGGALFGCGTLYSYSATSGLKVLANFLGPNGALGEGTLTLSGNTLYGTTYAGGAHDLGVIFSVETDGSNFTVLHQFAGTDGAYPSPTLRIAAGGVLYGIAPSGGTHGKGVLFSLTPSGIFKVLHQFAGGADGNEPYTLLLSGTGTLIGSTFLGGGTNKYCTSGCGALFEYVPASGRYSVPYSYTTTGGDGGLIGGIAGGDTVYGVDNGGVYTIGARTGYADQGDFNVLQEGNEYSGPLLASDGSLYGVNAAGPNQSVGGIYNAVQGRITILMQFGNAAGYNPAAQPILLPGDRLIGTTIGGGLCATCGAIWTYSR